MCNDDGKQKINEVLNEAFTDAGAAEHEKMRAGQPYNKKVLQSTGPPQIYWWRTCVAAFLPELEVEELVPIGNMPRVDS